jgi:negative regulator of replication initiation
MSKFNKRFTISMGDDLYDWISSEAEENGVSLSTMVTLMLHQYRKVEIAEYRDDDILEALKDLAEEVEKLKKLI